MLKLVGALLVSASVACIGFLKLSKYSKRVKYLDSLRRFVFSCADEMRFSQNSVFTMFNGSKGRELAFLKDISVDNISDRRKLICILENGGIEADDVEQCVGFLQGLGTSDIDGQQLHCSYYKEVFTSLLNEAKSELDSKGRLMRTVYLFFGAALFIILI